MKNILLKKLYFFLYLNIILLLDMFSNSNKLFSQREKLEIYHEYLYKLNKYKNNKDLIDDNGKLKLKNIIIYSKNNNDQLFIPTPIEKKIEISADTYSRNKLINKNKDNKLIKLINIENIKYFINSIKNDFDLKNDSEENNILFIISYLKYIDRIYKGFSNSESIKEIIEYIKNNNFDTADIYKKFIFKNKISKEIISKIILIKNNNVNGEKNEL